LDRGWRRGGNFSFDDEEVRVWREEEDADGAVDDLEEGTLLEGVCGGEIGERSEGGEGVAGAEEEVAVAEVPKITAAVVKAPLGASEDVAGGKLDEERGDVAVLVGGWVAGDALEEGSGVEGEEEVMVVDEVEREHGAAGGEELRVEGLETERFEGDAHGWLLHAREERSRGEEGEHEETRDATKTAGRDDLGGNLHELRLVSVGTRTARRTTVSQTHEPCQRGHGAA
jgi:hypothetical protein